MAAQDDIPDEAESKANETDDDVMLDAKEQLDDDLGNTAQTKKYGPKAPSWLISQLKILTASQFLHFFFFLLLQKKKRTDSSEL